MTATATVIAQLTVIGEDQALSLAYVTRGYQIVPLKQVGMGRGDNAAKTEDWACESEVSEQDGKN